MDRQPQTLPRPASRRADIAVGLIATLGIVSLCAALATRVDHKAVLAAIGVESSASLASGVHHGELKMSFEIPGVTDLTYFNADGIEIGDNMEVVGVEVGGETCCFVMANMLPPDLLILNGLVGGRAVSITYGEVEDRIRIFTADHPSPLPLGMGGMDAEDRLVLLLGGERYAQCSSAVPLQDMSYVRTTWSQWRESHPSTKVCVPGGEVYGAADAEENEGEAAYGDEPESGVEGL